MLLLGLLIFPAKDAQAFEFKGFGDITFTKSDAADSKGRHGTFAVGGLNLYASHTIADRFDFLTEIVLQAGPDSTFDVNVMRLQIGYVVKDWLTIRAGRFHNTLGYWNVASHHGFQLQTTIDRPRLLAFERDGGIPAHAHGWPLDSRLCACRRGVSRLRRNGRQRPEAQWGRINVPC